MAIQDLESLKDAVLSFMLREDTDLVTTDDQLGIYVQLCESELNRELRIRELEDTAAIVTVAGQNWVELPEGFKKIGTLEFDDRPFDIEYKTRRQLKEDHAGQSSGRPRAYTIYGDRIYFGPTPDAVYNLTIDFYTAIEPLVDADDTNSILTTFPDVYLYGALKQAYLNTKDIENATAAATNYNAVVGRIKAADIESTMPTKLVMKTKNAIG